MIGFLCILATGFSSGCASSRWSAQPHEQSWGEQAEHTYKGVLLIDGKTGDTWQLRYLTNKPIWQKIERGGANEDWPGTTSFLHDEK